MPENKSLYTNLSDLHLFGLSKRDDLRAFEEIYRRHWPGLMNLAYRKLQSRQKAEDTIQDIFISLYQKRETLELTVSLKAYLYQALKFKVLNIYRDESTRNNCQREIFLKQICKNDSANYSEVRDLSRKISEILNHLPEKCRRVFLLSRHEHLSHKDISAGLNISVSTVEKHIVKALKVLRTNLKDYQHVG
jgi:RNA polymerase sigma-70 factor (ECF subfamily)